MHASAYKFASELASDTMRVGGLGRSLHNGLDGDELFWFAAGIWLAVDYQEFVTNADPTARDKSCTNDLKRSDIFRLVL